MINQDRKTAMTLIEILLAVCILAMSILPISRSLFSSAQATKEDEAEVEGLEKACSVMDKLLMFVDFEDIPQFYSPGSPAVESLKFTEVKYFIEWNLVPLPQNFLIHTLPYHDPCPGGIEALTDLAGKIKQDSDRTLLQVDREKLKDLPANRQVDLVDIKLTVKWKRKSSPDADFEKKPIILYTRKARL